MRLSDSDASFLYQETASAPMHGCTLSVVEGVLSFDTYVALVESRIHLIPRYRHRLAFVPYNLAHPKWVDDPDFKIENHIKPFSLPPGSTLEDALTAVLGLAEPLLPRDRPLWLTYVIDGVPDRTVIAQLGHHAFVDGATGIDISLTLFDLQAKHAPPEPPEAPWDPKPLPTLEELATEAMAELGEAATGVEAFAAAARLASRRELADQAFDTMTRLFTEPAITAPWNAGPIGPKRNFLYRAFGFGDFRRVRRAFGGTINDVVLALTTESAARYLEAHDEPIRDGDMLRVMCPVNVRREGESGTVGNRVSGIFPSLPAQSMPIVERLQAVITVTSRIKENQEAQALELFTESTPSVPPAAMAPTLWVSTPFDPTAFAAQMPAPVPPRMGPRPPLAGFNFTCTNVPGVQVTQYAAGHRVLDTLGLLMLGGNLGFGVSILSYNQQLYFNFICDPRLMPDLELMVSGVEDAFAELLDAATVESAQVNAA